MTQWILVTGAIFGALAVATGAFGAHALQGVLDDRARGWYDTAVTYHAGHALAIVACGLTALYASSHADSGNAAIWLNTSAICFVLGVVVFSGSLYTMAFTGITRLGMITPIGGLFMIIAWLSLAVGASKLGNGVT
ncbi:MAG: DUF423 domain-containing protein [Granulosicoccus sp.]